MPIAQQTTLRCAGSVQAVMQAMSSVNSAVNSELQRVLARKLLGAKAGIFPGEKVEVFTRQSLSALAHDELLVSPKTDGQNYLLVSFAAASAKTATLYLVDGRCLFYQLAHVGASDHAGHADLRALPKSFVLNGEVAVDMTTGTPVYQVFDVLLFRNTNIRHMAFTHRLKRFFELQAFLVAALAQPQPACEQHGGADSTGSTGSTWSTGGRLRIEPKRFYDTRTSLRHVLSICHGMHEESGPAPSAGGLEAENTAYCFKTDGLIFVNVRKDKVGPSLKWKPIDREEYDQTVADVEAGKFQPRIREVSFALDEFEKDIDGYNRKLQEALYGH